MILSKPVPEKNNKKSKAKWLQQTLIAVYKIAILLNPVVWTGAALNTPEIFLCWAEYGWYIGLDLYINSNEVKIA